MIITCFEDINKPKNLKYVSEEVIFERIRSGGSQLELINKLRSEKDKVKQKKLKESLPGVLWSGKFKHRSAAGLLEYSKLIVLDFDNILGISDLKKLLESIPWVYVYFDSPTGTGLKVLVRVSSDNHLGHFLALQKYFEEKGYEIDISGKDISRSCFFSYDPNLYVNKGSSIYTEVILPAYSEQDKYNNLKKWLENKGEYFTDGNRNSFLTKIVGAANRFGIDRDFLLSALETDFPANGSDYNAKKKQTIIYSLYTGHPEQHNTATFDEAFNDRKIDDILAVKIDTTDIIYLDDVRVDLIKIYDDGIKKGPETGFPSVDDIFRRVPGQLNVLTGIGNHGKSMWQQQMDLVDAAFRKDKSLYFSPESFPPTRWYRQLAQALVGKSIRKDDPNRMSREEYDRAIDFINTYFIYIYPKDLPTPEFIIGRFMEMVVKHGVKTCVIDPWNQLFHKLDKRDDVYLAEALSKFERFALQHEVKLTIIAHPNRTFKSDDGNYKMPDVYDLNGGPVWNARSSNIMVYHRPFFSTNPQDMTCEIATKKIKDQELCGIPGTAILQYDRNTFRFVDQGYNPLNDFKL